MRAISWQRPGFIARGAVYYREPRKTAARTFSRNACMMESEPTYGERRKRDLEDLLRKLAARIVELDAAGELLKHAGELTRIIGDVRSELFHYEVRATYDTPEIAESRRIVDEAKGQTDSEWEKTEWERDDEEPTW
ncbi:MAG TPA: hypothetical protein VIP79_04635 [Gemmatimonadaceae bacterium]